MDYALVTVQYLIYKSPVCFVSVLFVMWPSWWFKLAKGWLEPGVKIHPTETQSCCSPAAVSYMICISVCPYPGRWSDSVKIHHPLPVIYICWAFQQSSCWRYRDGVGSVCSDVAIERVELCWEGSPGCLALWQPSYIGRPLESESWQGVTFHQ